ncbi:UNVERIFIED_ORG: hypothetical protein J2Y77_001790 [Pseudomonas lini]|uniref:Uncharacterized protein n=1 Tax=Pseudomonas viciae TaxID=2505979 RepID=A0ABY8PLP5_9PSED|nr:hypothetical protein [Pseudomonas viciae]UZE89272.1 hypothetical protein LOY66_14690 [Pseudomonas viciae]WGO96089.1 hypothetical protein QCD61_13625 [Pseudomonas viciae]
MRILKALLLPLLLILSLIGVDRLVGKHKTSKHPLPQEVSVSPQTGR